MNDRILIRGWRLSTWLLLSWLAVSAWAQDSGGDEQVQISDQAEQLGFDLAELKSIDDKYADRVGSHQLIGCSAMIVKDGKEVFFGSWGQRNQQKKLPVTRDTIFRIYSMTKPITSVAAMQLVEQGKLKLDAPVATYLPEFKDLKVLVGDQQVPPNRDMTVRDLMRHTSGLTYGFFGDTAVDRLYRNQGVLATDINLKMTVSKLSKIPLQYQPGARFHYSASTDVLGRVVEVVSGLSLADYFQQSIFAPLGMEDTFFVVPSDKQKRFAQLYTRRQKKLVPASPLQSIRFTAKDNQFFSGGGGLCSTMDDYWRFCRMLLQQGQGPDSKVILKPESLQEMFRNQLTSLNSSGRGGFKFGLGFREFPQGDYGWGGAAGTRFYVHPEKNMCILFMTQILPYGNTRFENIVRDTAYRALD